jgi:hypothetical protein
MTFFIPLIITAQTAISGPYPTTPHPQEQEHASEETQASNTGIDKGVLEVGPGRSFKLSAKALEQLKIKTAVSPSRSSSLDIPLTAIAFTRREQIIYKFENDFFYPVEVKVIKKTLSRALVKPLHLDGSIKEYAIDGVKFLRNIEVDIFSGEESHH